MSGWKYKRKELYQKVDEIINSFEPDDNKTWELDTKLKNLRTDLIKRK